MSSYEQKIVQYLEEAHATEMALTRVLESQVAMTPRGALRTVLENHLDETRGHADRVRSRIAVLARATAGNPLQAWIGLTEAVVGQALALGKAPLDLVRGTGGEEKLLKNAKDDCATEALEIATYTAIERLARRAEDRETAELAASILADERRMLDRLLEEIPKLTEAVASAELEGRGLFDATTTGAADAARSAADAARGAADAARRTTKAAARTTRTPERTTRRTQRTATRRGGSQSSGRSRETNANAGNGHATAEAPISGYDDLSATDVIGRLPSLSQRDLAAVKRHERANQKRSTVLERVDALEAREPWPGYDEQDVADVRARLGDSDEATAQRVRDYERRHKDRAGVIEATERRPAVAQA